MGMHFSKNKLFILTISTAKLTLHLSNKILLGHVESTMLVTAATLFELRFVVALFMRGCGQ